MFFAIQLNHQFLFQNKYKYEMLNIINENVNIETDKLNDLTDELSFRTLSYEHTF